MWNATQTLKVDLNTRTPSLLKVADNWPAWHYFAHLLRL